MYDIRQFRPALYILLSMGVTGFAIAAQTPALWVMAMTGITLNAWLVKTHRFIPLPRLIATLSTMLAVLYVAMKVHDPSSTPILVVGEFLVLLHLVKLFEQRANRDYAQLLILSLLLMAAAAISTASLLFGLLLPAYLFVSLYCCLLFHLKMESDAAKAMMITPTAKVNPAALRQDQRRLAGSMRLLTVLVALVSVFMAVVVFLFFPRGSADGLFGRRFLSPPSTLTGFSEQVSMDRVAEINKSEEIVARVQVSQDGIPWIGTQPLLLRGVTLDQYSGTGDEMGADRWSWQRSATDDTQEIHVLAGGHFSMIGAAPGVLRQEISLQPTRTRVLFAIAGASELTPSLELRGRYFPRDGVMLSEDSMDQGAALTYEVDSSGELPVMVGEPVGIGSRVDPAIAAYARRPEVSGVDEQGRSLASLRETPEAPADVDHRIAAAIQSHLRTKFQYTLDLTDTSRDPDQDPIVAFLYNFKKGHCEYFAGAMTLMCKSLGMQARMVVGYHCDEFNSVGNFYIVRQSHAHAWVEVLTGPLNHRRWETFDPTSSNEAIASDTTSWLGRAKSLFNYLEFRWGESVVAYGQQNRQNLVEAMNNVMASAAGTSRESLDNVPKWLDDLSVKFANPSLISIMIMALIAALVSMVGYYVWERARLGRRAMRIGLGGLPLDQQRRLARQLGFYDDLLRLLERRGIAPPAHLTPMEFSENLTYLPQQVYHDVRRLTRLFYRIRFGQAELNAHRRRRLGNALAKIEAILRKSSIGRPLMQRING
jgi:protein-glutamine gamma-glutamyltransferase